MGKNKGFYGEFGGQFAAETLIPALDELEKSFNKFKNDKQFLTELNHLAQNYAGRPTPVYHAKNLSEKYNANIYLKREDLLHTGAHKLNNTIGQGLLAKYMGKKRIIAETGAGQHGVATATIAALLGLECIVYMGEKDTVRQSLNVKKMNLLGAKVIPVKSGSKTLKDAVNAALKDWVENVGDTYYLIGSVLGPHPFPEIVAHFQSVIGKEVRDLINNDNLVTPDVIVACVGGGSNAIGIFKEFVSDKEIDLIGVEGGGISDEEGKHARTIGLGKVGILHGSLTYVLQDKNNQIAKVHSISAGLDYPAIGPEHAKLHQNKRAFYGSVRDEDALFAFKELTKLEGIIPALESSHAIAYVIKNHKNFKGKNVLINLSGRGDKDLLMVNV